ncbi:type IV toxin-antitoxin system AbiEi family antitoxin [Mycobacterium sp. ITM-2016-00318]|uniref:type IV toxin-antitoxin system AbiEi family antitoxin n=1 Tax=Mycobacterium sp. ITM-2016-00318 TaxID=2099693 RepID=UPI000CF9FF9E|nr:type IV toxin-antitoxin system AbiEi family antitoxin [Mycobacterium sp. ITM-2016-00318]WNG92083.1 type IV toxin-antitoxin system AbiEi family antitoxin [Mycobacterium sp. ITM-2016-00318]
MRDPFIGTEAISEGRLTRGQLRWRHTLVQRGVYLPNDAQATLHTSTLAAWLCTGRKGVIAGRAAAALHGARWVDASTPIEIIAEHTRRRAGVIVHEERIASDEITYLCELPVTSPVRTALDIARHLPRDIAVPHLDALAAATGVTFDEVIALAERYRGARGVRRARVALALMDGGAQSPGETRLRLQLIDDGLPAPRTQIRVSDGFNEAFIDMGYDEPKVGLDYEGSHHSENRRQYVHEIGRADLIDGEGWIDIRVVKEHSRRYNLHRVRDAFAKRGWTPPRSARGS